MLHTKQSYVNKVTYLSCSVSCRQVTIDSKKTQVTTDSNNSRSAAGTHTQVTTDSRSRRGDNDSTRKLTDSEERIASFSQYYDDHKEERKAYFRFS